MIIMDKKQENIKEKGNIAIKKIIDLELKFNSDEIPNLHKLLYEIQNKYPYVPLIQNIIPSVTIELIRFANKNYHEKQYFEIFKTAILYFEWVFKDIEKYHYKNIKDYFDIQEIYKETNKENVILMSLKDKIKGIGKLKRYTLVWEWMEEYQSGEYVKYDDVVLLFENKINNKDDILTEEQWRAFVEKLDNVKYDEKLVNFYSERKNKYKISKDVKS